MFYKNPFHPGSKYCISFIAFSDIVIIMEWFIISGSNFIEGGIRWLA